MDEEELIVVEACYPTRTLKTNSVTVEFGIGAIPRAISVTVSVDKGKGGRLSTTATLVKKEANSTPNNRLTKLLLDFLPSLTADCNASGSATVYESIRSAETLISELDDELRIEEEERRTMLAHAHAVAIENRTRGEEEASDAILRTAVFYSHHLIARSKRALIKSLSGELDLSGLTLVGWPGAIVVEGTKSSIDFFEKELKRQNWKHFANRGCLPVEKSTRRRRGRQARKFSGMIELDSVSVFSAHCDKVDLHGAVELAFRL